jgi:hypothetical protein
MDVPKCRINKSSFGKSINSLSARTKVKLGLVSILKVISCGSSALNKYGQEILSASLKLEAADPPSTVIDC